MTYRPISYYWSSKNHTMSLDTEQWLERLPLADKVTLATSILEQCKSAFYPQPNHLSIVQLPTFGGDAS